MSDHLPEFEALCAVGCDIAFVQIPQMQRNLEASELQKHQNIVVMLDAAIDCFSRAVALTEHPELLQTLVDGIAKLEQAVADHEAHAEAWQLATAAIEAAKR